jgi:hypothetical protein
MDNRLIFLYFVKIAQTCIERALSASALAREYVDEEVLVPVRCGVTEWEDQSVRIDWTWNLQDVDCGRQIPRESRVRTPITLRKKAESVPFCFQENRRNREIHETVPQTNTGGMVE